MALKNQSIQPDQPLKTSAEKATRQRLDAFPVRVDLRRQGERVQGRYSFGIGSLDGRVGGNRLNFTWQWAGDYGRGMFETRRDGNIQRYLGLSAIRRQRRDMEWQTHRRRMRARTVAHANESGTQGGSHGKENLSDRRAVQQHGVVRGSGGRTRRRDQRIATQCRGNPLPGTHQLQPHSGRTLLARHAHRNLGLERGGAQGHISDNCTARRPGMSEQGLLYSPGELLR